MIKLSLCIKMFKKQKPLLPSLREKRRYIAFEVNSEKKVSFSSVKNTIKEEAKRLLGNLTIAKAGIIFLDDWKNQKGIIKVNRKYQDHIKAVFTQVNKIQNNDVLVKSIGVSGIINKARTNYIGG